MHIIHAWALALMLSAAGTGLALAETLSPGMSGPEVAALQNSLVAAGYLARPVDGDYGSTTKEAVALFQEAKGLPVTGEADDNTRGAIHAAENQGYRPGGGVVYAEGNRGSMIASMQKKLQAAGYLADSVDGVYGDDTESAVRHYQQDHNIPVSGVIDEMTYAGLNKETHPSSVSSGTESRSRFLYRVGDRGKDVRNIQERLKNAGYLSGAADGIYGDDTRNAVIKVQNAYGLSATGSIDHQTYKVISQFSAGTPSGKVLHIGDSGSRVVNLQNRLLLHGYNIGESDGIYGQATAEAVREFQKEQNLASTGQADEDVFDRLQNAPGFTGNYKRVYHMKVSAYTPGDGPGGGHTYMGGYAGKGHAAVDPQVIPLGSIVYIEGYGYALCDDIGGGIRGMHIDIGVDTIDQAYSWGTRSDVTVYLVQ